MIVDLGFGILVITLVVTIYASRSSNSWGKHQRSTLDRFRQICIPDHFWINYPGSRDVLFI